MMPFSITNIRNDVPGSSKKVIIYWLGGSGFVFKFHSRQIICIDPYLSDCVEKGFGFRRLSLVPLTTEELFFDVLLLTHDHLDHMDVDSFDILVKTNQNCRVVASTACADFLEKKKVDYQLTAPGNVCKIGDITVKTVPADHGDLSPEAVGFVISFAGRSLYFTGDTAFNEKLLADTISLQPEILIPCINGAFGNLNEREAAIIASRCNAKVAIPCHFWLFAEHGGSPGKFKEHLNAESPGTEVLLLTPGRGVEV